LILTAVTTLSCNPAGISESTLLTQVVQFLWRRSQALAKDNNRLPHWISLTTAALPTASLRAHSCVRLSPHLLPCCLVDLSFTTAEWPDVQLSFDVGGGRYLQPRSTPRSTRPQSNVTAPPPPTPQTSRFFSHYPSVSDYGLSIPSRPPFTATGTNALGPRLTTMPAPNTAPSVPYHYGSSPPNIVNPLPQPVRSEGSPPNTQGWSYRGCSTLV